jgi:AcrR family transcriptional regulator
MASTLRERRKQMLRDEILVAAHGLLAERGYAAMSMEELAGRVGVSKPTLYAHFPAKEDLVAALAAQILDGIFVRFSVIGAATSPLEQLVDLLQATVRLQLESRSDAMQLQMPEMVAILESRPELRERVARVDLLVIDLIRAARDAGELDPAIDLSSVARIFSALICAPHVGRLSAVEPPAPEALVAAVGAVFRRGLAPAADPKPAG